jgi:hypothetical protein
LQRGLGMIGRRTTKSGIGSVDGGAGRGVPLGGRDTRRPTGYNFMEDDGWIEDLEEFSDRDFAGGDGEGGPDRRRDPLRRR